MSRRMRWAAVTALLAAVSLAAVGCGGAAPQQPPRTPGSLDLQLETSLVTDAGTWATVVMGGSAAQHDNFWQLFFKPTGSTSWRLVTPPGTADNGGLVLATGAGQALTTAFLPSQALTYTPLIRTGNAGKSWSALSPLDAALAGTPDPLAAASASGKLLAVTSNGTAEQTNISRATWTTLASTHTLAATLAGRQCGLTALTAAAYTASGTPLLAGTCSRPGAVGIFAAGGAGWQATGPALPAALAGQPVSVLRLVTAGNQLSALITAGSGHDASILAAWSVDGGARWTESPMFKFATDGPAVSSGRLTKATASFGPGQTATLLLPDGDAAMLSGGRWSLLPALPDGTAVVALSADGSTDALTVDRTKLTVWRLPEPTGKWLKEQVISVPIQFGSSS